MRFPEHRTRDENLRAPILSETMQKRIEMVVRSALVCIGAIALASGICGVLGIVALDALGELLLIAVGVATILTGVFKVDLIQFVV